MSTTVRAPLPEARDFTRPSSSSNPHILVVTPDSEREPLEVKTLQNTPVPLYAKEQQVLDDLAMLFTVQEERCFSRASRDTGVSRTSLASSQLDDVSFIYQHIDFEVLSKCVPGFVKTHLNKNGRYLPETFILRVNYWRRRRALGEDSTAKRAAKEKENLAKENAAKNSGDQANLPTRVTSGKSGRPQSVSSKQTSLWESRVAVVSG